jgi:hypothetical protein
LWFGFDVVVVCGVRCAVFVCFGEVEWASVCGREKKSLANWIFVRWAIRLYLFGDQRFCWGGIGAVR